ncbi:glycosyltransferase [Micromonospora sp. BRA006-A]|nr:glycosyltransferase [Micromonospora sp. BRA006-A]
MHPNGKAPMMYELEELAAELGVADRVHLLPYVPHWQVSAFVAPADLGVIPIHHKPNHEIALITKFFEYAHGGLPMVVSDVRTMAEATRATGHGEVFGPRTWTTTSGRCVPCWPTRSATGPRTTGRVCWSSGPGRRRPG